MADPTAEELKLQQEAQKVLNDLKQKGLEISQETAEAVARGNLEREKEKIISADSLTNLDRRIGILQQINDEEENQAVRRARQKEIEELLTKQKKDQLSLDEQRLQKMMDAEDLASEEYRTLKKKVMEKKKELKAEQVLEKQRTQGLATQESIIKSISTSTLGSSKLGKAIAGGVDGMFKMWKGAESLGDAIKAGAVSMGMLTAATGIGIILLAVGAIAKLVETIFKLAIQTRDATVAFRRATGAAEKYGTMVVDLEADMRAVGVSMDEAAAAQTALYTSTTDYTMASDQAQKSLYETTALMAEFGVNVETSAKIAQAATKGLGMGIGEADDLLLSLSAHAKDIGVPINKMMEDFVAVKDELKVFGREGEQVFKRLAMVQKITGMEMTRILSIVEKFDTFEGAAKQAGQLNAAIGGNMVNAMDLMMTTDPVDRFNMIRDSIMNAAGSFDDMSYYQKRFYVQAAGLKDVGELAALMSGDMEALDGNIGMNSKSYAEQREEAKRWQSTMDILKNTLMTLMPVFKDLAKEIDKMVAEFANGEEPLKEIRDLFGALLEKEMIDMVKGAPAAIKGFIKELESFATSMKEVKGYAEDFFEKLKLGISIFVGITTALIAFATPIGWVGAAIAGLVAGIGAFIAMMKKKNSPSFLDLFTGGALAAGFKKVGEVLDKLLAPIKAVMGVFKSLGETIANTFSFDNIKKKVSGFVDWLPGEWGKSVDGIKKEMEIASPSKRMEREIINPTFVEPMQSVSAKMPQLVDDVYKEVDFKTPATKMQAALPRERMAQAMSPTQQKNAVGSENTTTVLEKTHQNITIPIQIGSEEIGTIVADIVEGKIGNISLKGALGIG